MKVSDILKSARELKKAFDAAGYVTRWNPLGFEVALNRGQPFIGLCQFQRQIAKDEVLWFFGIYYPQNIIVSAYAPSPLSAMCRCRRHAGCEWPFTWVEA